jgi:hypothetical protein
MPWAQIIAYLVNILAQVSAIRNQNRNNALETEPFAIQKIAANGTNAAIHPTYGLGAAHTERLGLLDAVNLLQINTASPHPATLTDILAAFGTIPVYTLPETPPPGYGGTTFGDVISWQMCALD